MIFGNEEDIYKIYLDGKVFYTTDPYSCSWVYIVDLNENDKSIEVVIKTIGANDCTIYNIYSKNGNKMNKLRTIADGWTAKIDKKGKIVVNNSLLDSIKPEIYETYYELNNNKIEEKTANIEKIKNKTFRCEGGLCFTQDKDSLKKYMSSFYTDNEDDYYKYLEKYGIYYYQEEFKFELINFEKGIWVNNGLYVKLKDGRKGYLFSHAYNLAG